MHMKNEKLIDEIEYLHSSNLSGWASIFDFNWKINRIMISDVENNQLLLFDCDGRINFVVFCSALNHCSRASELVTAGYMYHKKLVFESGDSFYIYHFALCKCEV